ncbi:MAG TPA: hypothetical protein VEC99_05050 [Clostridia bacterium]|nr:hypothetical protein [Clostridia bacterium]
MPQPSQIKWRPGDLVLHEKDPKIHAMLMEIIEIQGDKAMVAYLDSQAAAEQGLANRRSDRSEFWCRANELQDPALFLKTEEFHQTVRERLRQHSS